MYNIALTLLIVLFSQCVYAGDAVMDGAELKLTIHYTDGLSKASSTTDPPQIILFAEHTHLHLKIHNPNSNTVVLWRPDCPPGDEAIRFEFKYSEDSQDIITARINHAYTAGMGYPKTCILSSNDDLIFNVNFLEFWDFPVKIDGDKQDLFVRAIYESKQLTDLVKDPNASKVWVGKSETKWEKVVIINRSNRKFP